MCTLWVFMLNRYTALQSKKAVTMQSAELRKMTLARAFCSYCTNDYHFSPKRHTFEIRCIKDALNVMKIIITTV